MRVYKSLSVKNFHGVSAGNTQECSLKSGIGEVRDYRLGRSGGQAAQTPAGGRGLRSGAESWHARRVLAAEIRATEKGQMESRSETLRATELVYEKTRRIY